MNDLWELMARVEYARRLRRDAAIERVKQIHAPGYVCIELNCRGQRNDCNDSHIHETVCVSCVDRDGDDVPYPCPTLKALEPLPDEIPQVIAEDVIEVQIDSEAQGYFFRKRSG